MPLKPPAVVVFSQPVPAVYAKVQSAKLTPIVRVVGQDETLQASTAVDLPALPEPDAASATAQAVWRERAAIARAYAKILRTGQHLV